MRSTINISVQHEDQNFILTVESGLSADEVSGILDNYIPDWEDDDKFGVIDCGGSETENDLNLADGADTAEEAEDKLDEMLKLLQVAMPSLVYISFAFLS